MHVYSTATLSRVVLSNELNLTPASSMIYIYKHTLSNIIHTSKKGDELLNYISSHCWTQSPYANNVIKPLTNEIYCITSLHPYLKKCKYHDHVTFPKAQALRIVFDRKCKIETDKAYLAFYQVWFEWWFWFPRIRTTRSWLLAILAMQRTSCHSWFVEIPSTTPLSLNKSPSTTGAFPSTSSPWKACPGVRILPRLMALVLTGSAICLILS